MTTIQGILIACILLAVIFASTLFRSRLAYRLLAILLFLTATVFVLFPNLTTGIAKALGVGRGTDLLLYVSLIAGIHAFLLLYRRMRELERKITEQIRTAALKDASRNLTQGTLTPGNADPRETLINDRFANGRKIGSYPLPSRSGSRETPNDGWILSMPTQISCSR